jgi:hypothetical protein
MKMLVLRDQLVRREPADFRARAALVEGMRDALREDDSDRKTCRADCVLLRGRFVSALEQIRDGAYGGSRPCTAWLSALDVAQFLGELQAVPEIADFARSLGHGPPGAVADAARAVAAYLASAGSEAKQQASRHLVPRTQVRIDEQSYASGSDHPRVTRDRRRSVRGMSGIDGWVAAGSDRLEKGDVMLCDRRCCHWPFHDRTPHRLQLVDMCFDAELHVTLIRTRRSGM